MAKLYKHKKLTSILSCLLIVVLVFNICTIPAKAEVITLTVGAVAAVVALLGLMGITFATAGLAQKAAENFITANTDIWDDINSITVDNGTGSGGSGGEDPEIRHSLAINAGTLLMGKKILERLKEFFNKEDGVSAVPDGQDTSGMYLTYDFVDSEGDIWFLINNLISLAPGESRGGSYINNSTSSYYFYTITSTTYSYDGSLARGNWFTGDIGSYNFIAPVSGFYKTGVITNQNLKTSSGSPVTVNYTGFSLGIANYADEHYTNDIVKYNSNSYSMVGNVITPRDYYNKFVLRFNQGVIGNMSAKVYMVCTPDNFADVDIPYNNSNTYTVNQITNYFGDIINQGSTVTIPLDDIATQIEAGSATELNNSIDDLIDSIDGLRDAINNGNTSPSPTPSVPDTSPWDDIDSDDFNMPSLKLVFPFCVPFDLIDLVQTLNARAEAPVFTIPVNFDFVDYHDEIVVDLSEWESVAVVMRWGSTISFMLALILISRKMIRG